ncbi:alginate lyase family protein [Pleurocapsa sp. PCC 7319]|uniref:heparinase II/III family protein n=1 Tax=Pleurocapsa sp. PCC 7319 TaxID=118161 RepID=UPI00034B42BB|nr:alginate lyase family protein [Pleurocapsa sp. PCC 7319]
MLGNLKWYVWRLKAMTLFEILQRINCLLVKQYVKRRNSWIPPTPKLSKEHQDYWEFPSLTLNESREYEALLVEAHNYLQGSYIWLNVPYQESLPNWHFDPQTGKVAPLKFGLELNYRDYELVGNVKNIWEKSRHHHLTVISAAYALTRDEKYAIAVAEQLQDWLNKNPFPLGVNWTSSLELGVRLISWVWIDRLLRGSTVHSQLFGESGLLWSAIYWHQWLISKYYSHGSSANNHLIGEMAGLFISSCHWSVFPSSKHWQSFSWKILEQEISKQTFSSGLNREQAFEYHIFTTEFFLLAGLEAARHQITVSDQYQDLMRRMLEVIPLLVDLKGNLPNYGDGDEGMALQIRPHQSSRVDWLLRLGRQWIGARVPLPNSDSGNLAASLVNFPKPDTVEETISVENSIAFPDAGLYVLAQNRGKPQEVLCLADAGNLGFLSIAAHGHADALSFTLNIGGVPIIVDPGTYTYHADNYWRNYFRSTRAHNTIVVDNLDQSNPGGTFLWTSKAQTNVLDWQQTDDEIMLVAEHDGYTRLQEKIVHRRQLTLSQERLEIVDNLQGNGSHNIEWRLHFSPLCSVSLKKRNCLVKWDSGSIIISLDRQIDWSLLTGEQLGGWYSSGFNLKQPTTTLVGITNTTGSITFNNSIGLLEPNFYQETETEVADSATILN